MKHRVAAMPWVRDSFRVNHRFELNPRYWYVVLAREVSPAR